VSLCGRDVATAVPAGISYAAGGLATLVIGCRWPALWWVRSLKAHRSCGVGWGGDPFRGRKIVEVSFLDAGSLPWSGVTAGTAAWLHRESEDKFVAFSVNCTHLGCPVRWLPTADLFMCPCHGGVYYKTGEVAAGPPPRPLQQYPVRVRDGRSKSRLARSRSRPPDEPAKRPVTPPPPPQGGPHPLARARLEWLDDRTGISAVTVR